MPDIDVGRKKVVAFLEANNIKKSDLASIVPSGLFIRRIYPQEPEKNT